jgi:hypothetical protein
MLEERGGALLSVAVSRVTDKLRWQCSEGHEWEAPCQHVVTRRTWCLICAGKAQLTIDAVQALAIKRGGKCLSETYVNNHTKMEWQCAAGHRWWAKSNSIQQGQWCPACAGFLPLTLEDMHAMAAKRGGQCISEDYAGSQNKMEWRCAIGHEWSAKPNWIQQGRWCSRCAGKDKTIDDMHALATARGGVCLSETYLGSKTKLEWQCDEGHRWWTTPDGIKDGNWCPVCYNISRRSVRKSLPVVPSNLVMDLV